MSISRATERVNIFQYELDKDLTTDCRICLQDFKVGDAIVSHQTHIFHEGCLKGWVIRYFKDTCPLCNCPLDLESFLSCPEKGERKLRKVGPKVKAYTLAGGIPFGAILISDLAIRVLFGEVMHDTQIIILMGLGSLYVIPVIELSTLVEEVGLIVAGAGVLIGMFVVVLDWSEQEEVFRTQENVW